MILGSTVFASVMFDVDSTADAANTYGNYSLYLATPGTYYESSILYKNTSDTYAYVDFKPTPVNTGRTYVLLYSARVAGLGSVVQAVSNSAWVEVCPTLTSACIEPGDYMTLRMSDLDYYAPYTVSGVWTPNGSIFK